MGDHAEDDIHWLCFGQHFDRNIILDDRWEMEDGGVMLVKKAATRHLENMLAKLTREDRGHGLQENISKELRKRYKSIQAKALED